MSANYLLTMAIPIPLLSMPFKGGALRSLQHEVVEHTIGPRMWATNVNYADKAGIVCIFEVHFVTDKVSSIHSDVG